METKWQTAGYLQVTRPIKAQSQDSSLGSPARGPTLLNNMIVSDHLLQKVSHSKTWDFQLASFSKAWRWPTVRHKNQTKESYHRKGAKGNLKTRFINALCLFPTLTSESPSCLGKPGTTINSKVWLPRGEKLTRCPKRSKHDILLNYYTGEEYNLFFSMTLKRIKSVMVKALEDAAVP